MRMSVVVLAMLAFARCALAGDMAADMAPFERGAAVTEPNALRALDRTRFGLNRMMPGAPIGETPLAAADLFALPAMAGVRQTLDGDIDRYVAQHRATLPDESIGVGASFAFQLFDRAVLQSNDTRFVLSGVVNRMDRAFVDPAHCGEIRLLYRLMRTRAPDAGAEAVSPRLPMTLNLVLKARGDQDAVRGTPSCADIAKRWLDTARLTLTGSELAARLTGADGPLALLAPQDILRIETNLQIAHAPKSAVRDFRTDYMMKVFDYHPETNTFAETVMEDQIDRDRLLADADLALSFKAWLLAPEHLAALDRGTVLIPDQFLAKVAVAPTPVGFVNSPLQPAFGLVQGEEGARAPVFSEADVVGALEQAAAQGLQFQNIRSVAGFERRLNDIGCAGCHQTRGIGGFHFPGVDWTAAKPSNAIVVPGSPHFFGDQVRRRDILSAFADGRTPDFSRGFASRPQERGSRELAGTPFSDGWGGHCYARQPEPADNDKSFSAWTCASGLSCQTAANTRMGMCFISTR